ncbi:MAG: aminoacyl-tRNA hydrolase [Candidatus Daviesbacteria bacterium]|nr:aminoacyl-tRNA hydrolase [Candidatus Daviesbacteria bacterium]
MKLIIGLGNPESKYAGTRHNLGFKVLDELAKKLNLVDWSAETRFKSELIKAPEILLVKPQTYVNNSGMAVKLLTTYYKLPATNVIVIHDELDLPLGKIKVRLGGAAAGHHGVESVINILGTDQFIRVRLGIGNLRTQSGEHKGQSISAEKFVLEPFIHSEKPQVKHMIKQALKALDLLLEKGLESAQNQFN